MADGGEQLPPPHTLTLTLVQPTACHTPIHHALLHPHTMRSLQLHCDDLISLQPFPTAPSPYPPCLLHAWPSSSLPLSHVSIHPFAATAFSLTSTALASLHRHIPPPSPTPPSAAPSELPPASSVAVRGWPRPVTLSSHSLPPATPPSLASARLPKLLARQLLGRALIPHSFTVASILCEPHLLFISSVTTASLPATVTSSTVFSYQDVNCSPLSLLSPANTPSRATQAAATFPVEWVALTSFIHSTSSHSSSSPSPLRSSLLQSLGVQSTSLLLWGAQQSGKTFLLSALTSDTFPHHHFIHLATADLIASSTPTSPSPLLPSAISRAAALPSAVLVLDDVTALLASPPPFPHLTAQLHSLLASPTLPVIASATSPPIGALRFNRELGLRALGPDARRAVVTHYCPDLSTDVLQAVVARTHGCSAGSLARVCRHAELLNWETEEEGEGEGEELNRWLAAVAHVAPPSAVSLPTPSAAAPCLTSPLPRSLHPAALTPAVLRQLFPLVGGYDDVKRRLAILLHAFLHPPAAGARVPGVLLQGVSGSGKSLVAASMAALAAPLSFAVFHLQLPALLSPYLGETERALTTLFQQARASVPALVVIDDLPALLATPGGVASRLYATLLNLLDGIEGRGQVMVVATARGAVDEALRREGRLGVTVAMRPLGAEERGEVMRVVGGRDGVPWAEDVEWEEVGRRMEGAVGADLAEVVRRAAWAAWHEGGEGAQEVGMRHLEAVMAEMGWGRRGVSGGGGSSEDDMAALHREVTREGFQF